MPDKRTTQSQQSHDRKGLREPFSTVLSVLAKEATSTPEVNVGFCLRNLRESQSLSIRALAEKSGLAVNTLSLIENGKTSPSVSTLQQLAGALNVHITAFFETGLSHQDVVFVRAGTGLCAEFTHGIVEDLGAGLADRTIETFIFTLDPHAVSGTTSIVHTGQEFVYCIEGCIAYTINEKTYVLEPGDSLSFESHLPHRWQNVSKGYSKALLVLCPLDTRDRASELHFLVQETL
jgi:transcriptional regulator with XRE-family HTH domain